MTTKILSIIGARPQFIKAAAVTRVINETPSINEVVVHTGQHFDEDMSDVFFRELSIPTPTHTLGVHSCSHGEMTGRMLQGIELVIEAEQPDVVLVYGDTNSTLAGSLAAAKLHVPVAHVEAGLRSWNRSMPEEINRVLTDHISALLFCPTETAVRNLKREGVEEGVHHVGDVMYDATLFSASNAAQTSDILERLALEEGGFAVATLHREENTNSTEQLRTLLAYLSDQAQDRPIVFPVHPRTRNVAQSIGLSFDGLITCAPLGYLDMARLLMSAQCVFTDSGGLQKEAYFHRKPCVTLRDETEWVETVEAGWNRLWREPDYVQPRRDIVDYGNGDAARKVVEVLTGYSYCPRGVADRVRVTD